MNITRVEATNFRCFGEFAVDMPTRNGLHLVTGKNLETPALGANGTGKSTTFSAICYALYDKTASGQKAGSLLRRGAKGGYSVKLNIVSEDGESHTLLRSWKPNNLKLDGKEITEFELVDWFGLTFEQFLYSIYFPQQGNSFIDLGATAKLSFLSQLFSLDKWVVCSEKCKEKIAAAKLDLARAEQSKTLFLNEIDRVAKLIEAASNSSRQWNLEQAKKISDLQAEEGAVLASVREVPNKDELTEQLKEIQTEKSNIEGDKRKLQTLLNTLSSDNGVIQHKIKTVTDKIEKLVKQENTECPQCLQLVSGEHVEAISNDLFLEADSLEIQARAILSDKQKTQADLAALDTSFEEVLELYNSVAQEISQIDSLIRVEQGKKTQLKFFEQQIARATAEINPYEKQLTDLRAQELKQITDTTTYDSTILIAENKVAQYEFWQKRFPQVRLSILEEVIQELEIHFNQSFCAMGLMDWTIKIATEKELKSGATKNELALRLFKSDEEVDIDSLSGGEKQRLRVCTNIGVSDLVKARCGITCDLLMLDEPCASLSQEGIDNLLGILSTLGETQKIMLAEHRVLDSARFDSIFTLVKGLDGISIMEKG